MIISTIKKKQIDIYMYYMNYVMHIYIYIYVLPRFESLFDPCSNKNDKIYFQNIF